MYFKEPDVPIRAHKKAVLRLHCGIVDLNEPRGKDEQDVPSLTLRQPPSVDL